MISKTVNLLQELPASAASRLWASGFSTRTALWDAQNPGSSQAPDSPSAPKPPSSSNIPPRLDTSGIPPASGQSNSDSNEQQPQQPSVTPVGAAASEDVPQGVQIQSSGSAPSPPGSRGRVTSSPESAGASAASAASDAVPAPRIAQVLGYAGENFIYPALEPDSLLPLDHRCLCH